MNTNHAALWSFPSSTQDSPYRTTHQERTKQRGNRQQQQERQRYLERFWTAKDPGLSQGNIAVLKQSWRQRKQRGAGNEEAARQRGWKSERQPQKFVGGGTRGSVAKDRAGTVLCGGACPQCMCIARCGTFQLLVSAGLEWAASQVP